MSLILYKPILKIIKNGCFFFTFILIFSLLQTDVSAQYCNTAVTCAGPAQCGVGCTCIDGHCARQTYTDNCVSTEGGSCAPSYGVNCCGDLTCINYRCEFYVSIEPPDTSISDLDCEEYFSEVVNNPDNRGAILYLFCPLISGINIGLYVVGAVLIILILYGAIKAVSSLGNPKQLEGAKATWTHALLGFFIIVFVLTGILLLLRMLGVTDFNPFDMDSIQDILTRALIQFYENLYTN